jgi:hypothetical protein
MFKIILYKNIFFRNPTELKITDEERAVLMEEAINCYLCEKKFEEDDVKVVDHDHILSSNPRGIFTA